MAVPIAVARQNRLIAALDDETVAELAKHLDQINFVARLQMERPGEVIAHIFFPISGLGSVVTVGSRHKDQRIETGIFGREGMSATSVVLGIDRGTEEVYVQVAGIGMRMPARALREMMTARPALRLSLLRYVRVAQMQTAHTALANGRDRIETRLARWLAMARDRMETDEILLTHEFLALMLGCRRAGVTIAMHTLEGLALIRSERGQITILDRDGLITFADGSYGQPEAEYERLIGPLS